MVEGVACLNSIFEEVAVAHDVISYVVVHINAVRAMDGEAAGKAVVDGTVLEIGG